MPNVDIFMSDVYQHNGLAVTHSPIISISLSLTHTQRERERYPVCNSKLLLMYLHISLNVADFYKAKN